MNELGLYLSICGAIFLGLSVVKVCNQTPEKTIIKCKVLKESVKLTDFNTILINLKNQAITNDEFFHIKKCLEKYRLRNIINQKFIIIDINEKTLRFKIDNNTVNEVLHLKIWNEN